MGPDGSAERDWEARYVDGDTPWDKGRAHPALVEWLGSQELSGQILVPGSGAGHDVRALSRNPAAFVTGLDVAPSATGRAREFPRVGNERYVTGDFFTESGRFDGLFEHTCFCAIPPGRRGDYARAAARTVRPGGLFLAIFYRDPAGREGGGPPFGCGVAELDELFGPAFEVAEERVAFPTFEGRENRELLRLMRRRGPRA